MKIGRRRYCVWALPVIWIAAFGRPEAKEDAIGRVVVLTMANRASLVLDLPKAATQTTSESLDDLNLLIDIGPVTASVVPEELEAPPDTPFVARVSIQDAARPGEGRFVRLRVTLRNPARSQVRIAGSRVYVDFAPPVPAGPTSRPRENTATTRRPQTALGPPAIGQEPRSRPSAARPEVTSRLASAVPEADVLQRARTMAQQPDVRGLEGLRADLLRRREQPGSEQPPGLKQLLDEVERYTNEARARQLQQDALAFRQLEYETYRRGLRPILMRIVRLEPMLAAVGKTQRGPSTTLEQQATSLARVETELREITAPSELAAEHESLIAAVALVTEALRRPGDVESAAEAAALVNRARVRLEKALSERPKPQ